MDRLDFDFFLDQLHLGKFIDETQFYFADDPSEFDYILGFLPEYDLPYWVGGCDVEDGCEFKTAEELLHARVFDGRSLAERWDMVCFVNIWGIGLDDWLTLLPC